MKKIENFKANFIDHIKNNLNRLLIKYLKNVF
jgi:hypothetical protein